MTQLLCKISYDQFKLSTAIKGHIKHEYFPPFMAVQPK